MTVNLFGPTVLSYRGKVRTQSVCYAADVAKCPVNYIRRRRMKRKVFDKLAVVFFLSTFSGSVSAGEACKTLVWSKPEQCRVTSDRRYEDVNIDVTEPVVIEEGATLTLKNVFFHAVGKKFMNTEGHLKYAVTVKGTITAEDSVFTASGAEGRNRSLHGGDGMPACSFFVNASESQNDGRVFLKKCTVAGAIKMKAKPDSSRATAKMTAEECFVTGSVEMGEPGKHHVFKKCVFGLPYGLLNCGAHGPRLRGKGSAVFEECTMLRDTLTYPYANTTFINCWFPNMAFSWMSESTTRVVNCRMKDVRIGTQWPGGEIEFAKPGTTIEKMTITYYGKGLGTNPTDIPRIRGYFKVGLIRPPGAPTLEMAKKVEIVRGFPVFVTDGKTGKPVAEKKIQVIDKGGDVITEGRTDREGFVELEVRFKWEQYEDGNFFIEVDGERRNSVSMLTDTRDGVQVEL